MRGSVVRIAAIWTAAGRIISLDQPGADRRDLRAGRRRERGAADRRTAAEVSDLTRPENRFERPYHKLLEVYLPIAGPHGTPLLFETYQRVDVIAARGRRLLLDLAARPRRGAAAALGDPVAAGWPHGSRAACATVSVSARTCCGGRSSRRRSNGVTGRPRPPRRGGAESRGHRLVAVGDGRTAPPEIARSLEASSAETRRTIRELRSLLVDIYPPDLHRTGIEAAVSDLVAAFANRGIATTVDIPRELALPPEA